MNVISGRDLQTGRSLQVSIEDGIIAAISDGPPDEPAWLAPGLVDLQINGCQGFDLNADALTPDTVIELSHRVLALGVTTYLPTIITACEEKITSALRAIASARQSDAAVRHMICGVHVEGPHLSPHDGPRGAHPLEHIRPPSLTEFDRWQQACGDLVKLVTVSPHYEQAPHYIAGLRARGVLVSIGHTDASTAQIHAAVNAGATLCTHLGNGVAGLLPRHPNLLWTQLAEDRLWAMFIADGYHLPGETLKAMLRAKGLDRSILVSDTVALGGMPPGLYETPIGGFVELSAAGRLSMPGTGYLAGSVTPLKDAVAYLLSQWLSLGEAWQLASRNPANILGRWAELKPGAPADLVRFTHDATAGICVQATRLCV